MRDDETAIRNLITEWLDATKKGDLETVLSLMTEDVVFMIPGQEPFGKETFAANSKAQKDLRIEGTSDIQEMHVLGDWAWIRNHLNIKITLPGEQPKHRSGYTLTILKKNPQGKWLLARDANLLVHEK